ncbi:peptidyl-glycine alpha-amidating monooxygenase B-like [Ostrea edulis]|uniref:peptidyl-glycine alpha-amidating monooxygenase B-like n=1 Tax=Ostrea edulis TaxID=37623 RepID=UPI0024AE9F59|nr:peptidyl-glycine alpha-amidating monooxygenase B-like [Ostrea edulis]XP_056020519.1 peptidyl-glycine alpha-amidating monooxygenase B-like [Ostrea edulis]
MAAAIVIFLAVATVAYGRATNYGRISLADLPRLFDDAALFDEVYDQRSVYPAPEMVPHWPGNDVKVGQVGGIAVDNNKEVVIFHRGSRSWGFNSFDQNNNFVDPERHGPIKENTLIRVDPSTGHRIESFGSGKFYMPHGLTIDKEGNIWVTDVGLHQVMKIPKGSQEPNLTLGVHLTPGSDDTHFCKPTDVAVASDGNFFVSDGYCNGRIMKFSKEGKLLHQWGNMFQGSVHSAGNADFFIPHSLTLIESRDTICVADREHGRIQCFCAGLKNANETGQFVSSINHKEFGKVFAISYDPNLDVIYAVNGQSYLVSEVVGFTLELSGNIVEKWSPDGTGFQMPHDVAVSPDGSSIYVGEIQPDRVTKFRRV